MTTSFNPYRLYEARRQGPWRIALEQCTVFGLYCSVCGDRYDDDDGTNVFDTIADAVRTSAADGWIVSAAPIVDGPAIHATYAVCERDNARHDAARDLLMPPMSEFDFGLDGQDPLPGLELLPGERGSA